MKFLHYVFTTALEGGISYWAQCEAYHWANKNRRPESTVMDTDYADLTGFYALITPVEDAWSVDKVFQTQRGHSQRLGRPSIIVDGYITQAAHCPILCIDTEVIERGVNMLVDGITAAHKSGDPKAPFSSEYLRSFVIQWMTDGEDGDSDAYVCDTVVQLGLFGEVVYG